MKSQPLIRVALIHDWLTGMRGGESVLEAIAELFPTAELHTLIHLKGRVSPQIESLPIHTSFLQGIPGVDRRYRHFLPCMPAAVRCFDLRSFDLVISSSHCVAKGVRKAPEAVHVSYIHAPMRYMWDRFMDYFGPGRASRSVRLAARILRPFFQAWDRRVSQADRVDRLIGNSKFIARQIELCYGRKAQVIHPFAELSRFSATRQPGSAYLMVGAFAPNKRVDLAIEAFNRLKLPLRIVGEGQDGERLRSLAGPSIEFLGSLSNERIAELYSQSRAFVFPGLEDFGITPVEALAAGLPVIALGQGGALESLDAKTGIFFLEQTVESLMEAVQKFESGAVMIREEDCRARARHFTRERFQSELLEQIRAAWLEAGKPAAKLESIISSPPGALRS